MNITIYTDGGSRGNPGESSIGFVIYDGPERIMSFGSQIGKTTNNVAEFMALHIALFHTYLQIECGRWEVEKISIKTDSELMEKTMNGKWRAKHAGIRFQLMMIKKMKSLLKAPVEIKSVPREQNTEADSLVNQAFFGSLYEVT